MIGLGCVVLSNACDDVSRSATQDVKDAAADFASSDDDASGASTSSELTSMTAPPSLTTSDAQAPDAHMNEGDASDEERADGSVAPDAAPQSDGGVQTIVLPPLDGDLDYQLGGAYALPEGVSIVSRDRTASPEAAVYNICYVNGFQVQPDEEDEWAADLLLRDDDGDIVIDEDWNEAILDIGTADKRERIASVVGQWIAQCAREGYQAVEVDNLDTYTRSGELLVEDDAVDLIARLARIAHAAGLAIAQKNSVELVPRKAEMGTDFVVSEECNTWNECEAYIEAYGRRVLMIEYDEADFERGCELYGEEFSIVYRDKKLLTPASALYRFDAC